MGDPISAEFGAYLKRVGLTPQDLAEQMRQFQRDCRFLSEHKQEWQERHPNRFVAVYDGKVVGWGKDPHRLIQRLRRRAVPVERTVIKFVWAKGEEPVWILATAA